MSAKRPRSLREILEQRKAQRWNDLCDAVDRARAYQAARAEDSFTQVSDIADEIATDLGESLAARKASDGDEDIVAFGEGLDSSDESQRDPLPDEAIGEDGCAAAVDAAEDADDTDTGETSGQATVPADATSPDDATGGAHRPTRVVRRRRIRLVHDAIVRLEDIRANRGVDVEPAPRSPKKIEGFYRHGAFCVPEEAQAADGISVFGRLIKSFVFSTDVVTIRNCNADAVLAVYPFTCQPAITQALIVAAECPVFTGVSGATTGGGRSVEIAMQSEMQGVAGVVTNSTTPPATIAAIAASVDIPVVATIVAFDDIGREQIDAGAAIVNVAAGRDTPDVVRAVRAAYPDLPIMASGGKTGASIAATIAAGADAISWTPPSMTDLQHDLMAHNRQIRNVPDGEGQAPDA